MAVPHLFAESLQSTELKLLDGALSFAQAVSNFFNAAFFDKPLADDAALNFGEFLDQTEEKSVAFDEFHFFCGHIRRSRRVEGVVIALLFAIGALELVGDSVGGDAEEPRGEGRAAPFVRREIRESFVKDFGRKILGGGAVVDAADDEKIDPLEMELVESVEFRRVGL